MTWIRVIDDGRSFNLDTGAVIQIQTHLDDGDVHEVSLHHPARPLSQELFVGNREECQRVKERLDKTLGVEVVDHTADNEELGGKFATLSEALAQNMVGAAMVSYAADIMKRGVTDEDIDRMVNVLLNLHEKGWTAWFRSKRQELGIENLFDELAFAAAVLLIAPGRLNHD